MKNLANTTDVDTYNIWLVNKGASAKLFWCFLQQPESVTGPDVYGNSDAYINVEPNYGGTNSFGIPLQYTVGAGASNKAVGLDVQINSSYLLNANIKDSFNVKYATVPPNQGPDITKNSTPSSAGTISLITNNYDEVQNNNHKWYENMSFGIQSENGFLGVTWQPSPSETTTLTPKFSFYVATGNFSSNELVDLNSVSTNSAEIELSDFDGFDVTVTLNSDGSWTVTPGTPQ